MQIKRRRAEQDVWFFFICSVNISTINNFSFSYFCHFPKKKNVRIEICHSNHSLRIAPSGWNFPLARQKQVVWIIDITIHIGKKIIAKTWDLSKDSFSMSRTPRYSFSWLCLTDIPWSEKMGCQITWIKWWTLWKEIY